MKIQLLPKCPKWRKYNQYLPHQEWEVTFQLLAKYWKSKTSSKAKALSVMYPKVDMRITQTTYVVCESLISQALKKDSSETDGLKLELRLLKTVIT